MDECSLSRGEEALARSRLYSLFQVLSMDGVTAQSLAIIQAIPELAAQLSMPIDGDSLAAAHQTLFGFNLFPFESIFLDGPGELGGERSEAVRMAYQAVGYQPTQRAGAADHLGEELGLLAHLCAAEADGWADGQETVVEELQHEQRRFFQVHLLRWLVPCVVAIQRHDNPFFREVATIVTTLVAEHYAALLSGSTSNLSWQLCTPPSLLANPKSSLHDIATFLTTPAYSGFFLSRHLINQIGRQHRLPRGFGSREQMVTNLFRSAAHYELLPALLDTLGLELRHWQRDYEVLLTTDATLAPYIQPWLQRITETIALLLTMDASIAHTGGNIGG